MSDSWGNSHKTLEHYYEGVYILENYLELVTESPNLRRENDSPNYLQLLEQTRVATQLIGKSRPLFQICEPIQTQSEIVDLAQKRVFASSRKNIITLGYRYAEHRNEHGKPGRPHIAQAHVNTEVTTLKSADWQTMLERIGADSMLHLLTSTSVFYPIDNGSLCQLTGTPMHDLVIFPIRVGDDISSKRSAIDGVALRPRKRLKLTRLTIDVSPRGIVNSTSRRTAANIKFNRARIFYASPNRSKSGHTHLGLPKTHVLNQYRPETDVKDAQAHVEPPSSNFSDVEAFARHLSKHIFPRQYGIRSVFDLSHTRDLKDLGPVKTPKRLKTVLPLLMKFAERHIKYSYAGLCGIICPSKMKQMSSNPLDSSVILELMAEGTQLPYSSFDVSRSSLVIPHGASQAKAATKTKPRFADFSCSHSLVSRFIITAVAKVIPRAFWGCNKNFEIIVSAIEILVHGRKYETMTLHHVLQNFVISECEWLMPDGSRAQNQRPVATDMVKRRDLLEEFLYWLFEHFILPLIKGTFYVTESSSLKHQVLYFRHDDWDALCKPLLEHLTTTTFQHLDVDDDTTKVIMDSRRLGYAPVRLLPKETGVRPIANLGRRLPGKQSINQILQAAFQILTYEKNNQPELLGASVLGTNDIYPKLKAFKATMMKEGDGIMPKLYFVKLDVQACFDTIDQNKLLSILESILTKDRYTIPHFARFVPIAGRISKKFVRKAYADSEHEHFIKYASKLAASLRHAIFVDKVVYNVQGREEVLELLREHLMENIVKIGGEYYQQTVGIPQGSVLSTLLCSFFYGQLETQKLRIGEDPQSLLLRYIDDYLFITANKVKALEFLDVMNKGHPEYKFSIGRDKTLTNFECNIHQPNTLPSGETEFPWCGYTVDTRQLYVHANYIANKTIHVADSLTVERGRRPGVAFQQKMLAWAKQKSHLIFTDTKFNSYHVACQNVHANFLFTAMKMINYLKSWGIDTTSNHKFILGVIDQTIRYGYVTIRHKTTGTLSKEYGGQCSLRKSAVTWLGLHAFHAILRCRPTGYTKLISALHFRLHLGQHNAMRKQLEQLANKHTTKMIENVMF